MKFCTDILFILKRRLPHYSTNQFSSGLANSISMLVKMLRANSVDAIAREVVDNNAIDSLVSLYKPRVVVIEALWVVPEKLALLKRLHPNTQWVVRLHSKIPFIAGEGMAMTWIAKMAMLWPQVELAANNRVMQGDMETLYKKPILYLPNHYDVEILRTGQRCGDNMINVSCFGAIRPLKNQLLQAVAAILYADNENKKLRFHINATRIEGLGCSILKNIRALFPSSSRHQLVEHGWLGHEQFKELIRHEIDIGLQVSYSETYNIVAADHVDCRVPVVVSSEIDFVDPSFVADPNSVTSIISKIRLAMRSANGTRKNARRLQRANESAVFAWKTMMEHHLDHDLHGPEIQET